MQDPAAPRDVTPLARWADAQAATAPYGFDEFERLARVRGEGRRRTRARMAALAASISLVLVGTAVWQRAPVGVDAPAAPVAAGTTDPAATTAVLDATTPAAVPAGMATAAAIAMDGVARGRPPAVVRVHDAALRADLQDRIAVLDALLSEARAAGDDGEPLRQAQRSRALLADSLQHVAWADGLSGR